MKTLYFSFFCRTSHLTFLTFFLTRFRSKHDPLKFVSNGHLDFFQWKETKKIHDSIKFFLVVYCSSVFYCDCFFFSFKACTAPSMPLMLHNHRSVCWEDSQSIMVLGGGGNCFSFGTHLNDAPVFINLPPS